MKKKRADDLETDDRFCSFSFSFFFWDRTIADHLFDCGKLDGVCSSSTDLKIITIFRYGKRSTIFLSSTCDAIVEKRKEKKKTVHSTNGDWLWKISPSLCCLSAGNSVNGLLSNYNAPLAMHYLSDIRPEPARGLISFWYQTWGLISFWYQTCDGSGFEFVRTNYVQHQPALQMFSTMGEASHLCRFTLVVARFD